MLRPFGEALSGASTMILKTMGHESKLPRILVSQKKPATGALKTYNTRCFSQYVHYAQHWGCMYVYIILYP